MKRELFYDYLYCRSPVSNLDLFHNPLWDMGLQQKREAKYCIDISIQTLSAFSLTADNADQWKNQVRRSQDLSPELRERLHLGTDQRKETLKLPKSSKGSLHHFEIETTGLCDLMETRLKF